MIKNKVIYKYIVLSDFIFYATCVCFFLSQLARDGKNYSTGVCVDESNDNGVQ